MKMKLKKIIILLIFAMNLVSCGEKSSPFIYPTNGWSCFNLDDRAFVVCDGNVVSELDFQADSCATSFNGRYCYISSGNTTYVFEAGMGASEPTNAAGHIRQSANYGKSFMTSTNDQMILHYYGIEKSLDGGAKVEFSPSGRLAAYTYGMDEPRFMIDGYTDEDCKNRLTVSGGFYYPLAVSDSGRAFLTRGRSKDLLMIELPAAGEYELDDLEFAIISTKFESADFNSYADECIFQTYGKLCYLRDGEVNELTLTDGDSVSELSAGYYQLVRALGSRYEFSTFIGVPIYLYDPENDSFTLALIGEKSLYLLDKNVSLLDRLGRTDLALSGVANGYVFYLKHDDEEGTLDVWRCRVTPDSKPEKLASDVYDYRVTLGGHLYFLDMEGNLFFTRDGTKSKLIAEDVEQFTSE